MTQRQREFKEVIMDNTRNAKTRMASKTDYYTVKLRLERTLDWLKLAEQEINHTGEHRSKMLDWANGDIDAAMRRVRITIRNIEDGTSWHE